MSEYFPNPVKVAEAPKSETKLHIYYHISLLKCHNPSKTNMTSNFP